MDAPDHITGLGGQIPIQTTPSSTSDAISETGGSYNDDTLLNELTTHAHHHRHPLGRLNEYCAGCGRSIMDQEYLGIQKTDKKWHIQCLRCYDCNEPLDKDQSCYVKQGNIFCRTDYFNRFGSIKCPTCNSGISPKEHVMKAREYAYHCSCFICHTCNRLLKTGEEFAMRGCKLYCKEHFQSITNDHRHSHHSNKDNSGENHDSSNSSPDYGNHHINSNPSINGKGHDKDDDDFGKMVLDDITDEHGRSKRIRTSFKQPQLRTMKTYFALNHNPDSKDLKQLSIKTGLNKRVLQVWFQNARAKYRRSIQQVDKTNSTNSNGLNLVV